MFAHHIATTLIADRRNRLMSAAGSGRLRAAQRSDVRPSRQRHATATPAEIPRRP